MKMPLVPIFIILSLGLATSSCTKKKEPSHKLLEMQKRVKTAEAEVTALAAKLKTISPGDQGLGVKLAADQELAQARLDRLKLQFSAAQKEEGVSLETAPAGAPAEAKKEGGGGH